MVGLVFVAKPAGCEGKPVWLLYLDFKQHKCIQHNHRECVCVRVCVRACVRACVRVCECVCACVTGCNATCQTREMGSYENGFDRWTRFADDGSCSSLPASSSSFEACPAPSWPSSPSSLPEYRVAAAATGGAGDDCCACGCDGSGGGERCGCSAPWGAARTKEGRRSSPRWTNGMWRGRD